MPTYAHGNNFAPKRQQSLAQCWLGANFCLGTNFSVGGNFSVGSKIHLKMVSDFYGLFAICHRKKNEFLAFIFQLPKKCSRNPRPLSKNFKDIFVGANVQPVGNYLRSEPNKNVSIV
jgi:hypothetical protein